MNTKPMHVKSALELRDLAMQHAAKAVGDLSAGRCRDALLELRIASAAAQELERRLAGVKPQ